MFKNIVLCATAVMMLSGCYGKPSPDTTMRVYETTNTEKLKGDITKTFTTLGCDVSKSEWKKTAQTTETENKTQKSATYRYRAVLPNQDYSCFKVSNLELWVPDSVKKNINIVTLNTMDAKCYNNIGSIHYSANNDKAHYQTFFDELSKQSGLEAKRITVKYATNPQ